VRALSPVIVVSNLVELRTPDRRTLVVPLKIGLIDLFVEDHEPPSSTRRRLAEAC
jgi:hypothetical protein